MRSWVALLGLGLLLSTGCSSTRTKAEERRVLIGVGMSGREVVDRIGRPSKAFPVTGADGAKDQTVEVWAYTMTPPPGVSEAVEFALEAGALVVLTAANKGNGPNSLPGIKTRGKGRCTFWVGFGADGRVRGVTDLQELP